MKQQNNNKLIVILGPTASGKTGMSIKLAKKFNGEIVSADSRQVYRGLDVGSGKVTKKEMQGIPHHLLDVTNPKKRFSVAQYQKLAQKAISKIQNKNKIPFLVGGTGFYIQSIVNSIILPEVKPNWKLRAKLEKKSNQELFLILEKLDPIRAQNIDKQNPRRLLRALEIVISTGSAVPTLSHIEKPNEFDILQIGIKKDKIELAKLINKRLLVRLKPVRNASHSDASENNTMINEVKKLHKQGISWKRFEELGLEYKFVAQFLQNKITHQEMKQKIQIESEHFAKRQMTWFLRDKRIIWIKNYKQAEKLIKKFLTQKKAR